MYCLLFGLLSLFFTSLQLSRPEWKNLHWTYSTSGRIYASPTVTSETIFIGSTDQNLYAIRRKDGHALWTFRAAGAITSSACVKNGKVFFGSLDGHYYAVDSATGQLSWKFSTGGERTAGGKGYWGMLPADRMMTDLWDFFLSTPVAYDLPGDHRLYFGSSDGHLYCVDQRTGRLIWKQQLGSAIHSTPALGHGKIFAGTWDGELVAMDADSGKICWSFSTGGNGVMKGIQASPLLAGGRLYVGARNGNAYAIEAESGKLLWRHSTGDSWLVGTPVLKDSLVFFTTSDSFLLLAMNIKDGNPVFQFKANGYLFSTPATAGDLLFLADFTGQLYQVSIATASEQGSSFKTRAHLLNGEAVLANGRLDFVHAARGRPLNMYQTNLDIMNTYHSLGAFVSSPVIRDSILYIGSSDGQLYAIRYR